MKISKFTKFTYVSSRNNQVVNCQRSPKFHTNLRVLKRVYQSYFPFHFFFPNPTSQCLNPIPTSRIQNKSQCYKNQLFSLRIHKIMASKYDPTLSLILQENSLQFYRKHYLQTHGTAKGTKMAVISSWLRLKRRF